MSQGPDNGDAELQRLHFQADAREDHIREMAAREHRQDTLIERLRREAELRDDELSELRSRLAAAEHQLANMRSIRDPLTP